MDRFFQPHLIDTDPLIKLGAVERFLGKVFWPAPSRPTIVGWIEEGRLEGLQIGGGQNWYIYKSSLDSFIAQLQAPRQFKKAA